MLIRKKMNGEAKTGIAISRKVQKNYPQIFQKFWILATVPNLRDAGFFVCYPDPEVRTMNKGFIG